MAGNRLWVAGKFTHINGVAQKALGTLNATTGREGPLLQRRLRRHPPSINDYPRNSTNVLQISTNPANNRLVAVGNFTSVNGAKRSQIASSDIGGAAYTMTPWYTKLYESDCSVKFETYMTDVEYSPDGSYFVVSTTGA